MIAWLKNATSRMDFYASHCYGRIKSCIPLSIFYAVDGLSNGALKLRVRPLLHGTIPAIITFLYYLYSFISKARETYQSHPDNLDLEFVHEKLLDTTEMITHKLKKNRADAEVYLEALGLEDREIEQLTSPEAGMEALSLYPLFYKIHDKIHPKHKAHWSNFIDAALHSITHLNEYLLLKYFADINLLLFEELISINNILGLAIIGCGLYSGYQTFSFCKTEKTPSTSDIYESITNHFRFFKKERQEHGSLLRSGYAPSLNEETRRLVKGFATHEVAQKCYMSCDEAKPRPLRNTN